jgi:hypothetical protein
MQLELIPRGSFSSFSTREFSYQLVQNVYQITGVSPHDELAVVGDDESGEFHDENEGFDELEQLLLE